MSSINYSMHTTYCPFTRTSIPHVSQSPSHPFTISSTYHVICSPCHLLTIIVHVIHVCHPVINSPCHPVTLSSIHPAINSHYKWKVVIPCCPFTMSSSQDHGPCHPFTILSIHRLSQSPWHSGHISSQVTRPLRSLTKKSSWSPTTFARGASTQGRSSSPFFACATFPSCSHPRTLPIPLLITSSLQLEQLRPICIEDL